MHRPPNTVERARRVLDELVRPAILRDRTPFTVEATGERRTPFARDAEPLAPFAAGQPWGRAWHTRWFRLTAAVPAGWDPAHTVAEIDLGFSPAQSGFQAEGLVWRGATLLHAVQPDRRLVRLDGAAPGDAVELWVEAVSSPWIFQHGFRPTPFGDPDTAPADLLYRLRTADLARHDPLVDDLALELHQLIDVAEALGARDPVRARALLALDDAVAALDDGDVAGTAAGARAALAPVLARPAAPGAHRMVATGHAHLDTAWLWPVSEARRKALRTFANAVALLDRHPDHHVTISQAQHYAWVAEDAPELFARVRELAAAGRLEPVGGMWVETDLNLPSGESLVRQFLHGQRAFEEWFGAPCPGAFLPDDFGYPGSLPQLVRGAGCTWFFTQKLSWNDTNPVPHHTFWWEGIDGSRVLTHFSPVETYNSTLEPHELLHAERTFAEHAVSGASLACFGHGDGGGGATDEMIRRARLAADWEPVPRVAFGSVDGFFAGEAREAGPRLPVWVGELYFELHRGTYSSQVGTKQGNRAAERALHEAELWSVAAGRADTAPALDGLWKRLLVQQFHDILPGSSVAWVHREAEAELAAVVAEAATIVEGLVGADGVAANPAPVPVREFVAAPRGWVDLPAFATGPVLAAPPPDVAPVVVGDGWIDNGLVRLAWDGDGHVTSLMHHATGRDVVPAGARANVLRLLRDRPGRWDAWDVDLADADAADPAGDALLAAESVGAFPLGSGSPEHLGGAAELVVVRRLGDARVIQTLTVRAGTARVDASVHVDWRRRERRLQVVWPVDVRATEATCGTQFGHVRRPRHANTSWDVARFEVCAQRYVHVGEHGFGVALMADGPRGYDVRGDALRLTLLRGPSFPDPHADRGDQVLHYALWPHGGEPFAAGLEDEAARVAHPVRDASGAVSPPVALDAPGALVSAVKHAADGSGDVIVRLWESRGGRAHGTLRVGAGVDAAWRCDLIERAGEPVAAVDGALPVALAPFEVASYRIRTAGSTRPA